MKNVTNVAKSKKDNFYEFGVTDVILGASGHWLGTRTGTGGTATLV